MACMCGSTDCPHCGPAQGSVPQYCSVCGCEEGQCENPEQCLETRRCAEDAYAEDMKWLKEHEAEIKAIIKRED